MDDCYRGSLPTLLVATVVARRCPIGSGLQHLKRYGTC